MQNKLNLKIYVGKTHDPDSRYKAHLYVTDGNTTTNKYLIHRAIKKYGSDNFIFQVIEEFESEKEALEAEKFWIEFFRSDVNKFGNEYGYNLTAGGEGILGLKHSQESKVKVSRANRGRVFSLKTRNKMSQSHTGKSSPMLGHNQTDKQKQMQSEMVSGEKNYFYGKSFSGELNHNSALTDIQAIEIIELLKNKKYKNIEIAKMYNVSVQVISKIKKGRTRAHLPR